MIKSIPKPLPICNSCSGIPGNLMANAGARFGLLGNWIFFTTFQGHLWRSWCVHFPALQTHRRSPEMIDRLEMNQPDNVSSSPDATGYRPGYICIRDTGRISRRQYLSSVTGIPSICCTPVTQNCLNERSGDRHLW